MSSIAKDLIEKYKRFVTSNSESVGQIESAARILSYVAPGGSAAVSELLSSAVSLVVLLNDHFLRTAAKIQLSLPSPAKQLAFCFTILDQVEVFLELAAYERRGDQARWFIVVAIQLIKFAVRFLLLFKHNLGIVPNPPIPSLKRDRKLHQQLKHSLSQKSSEQSSSEVNERRKSLDNGHSCEANSQTFTLKSTGRVVRSLSGKSDNGKRTWTLPVTSGDDNVSPSYEFESTPLNDRQTFAECLHILRPLIHLACMFACGQSSWKPWLIACGVDLSSLYLMGGPEKFNHVEKEELKRRTFMMLLYLLRSPFYDRFSKTKLLFLLGFLAHKVPVVRLIVRPLLEYLPIWQKIYFYVWMT